MKIINKYMILMLAIFTAGSVSAQTEKQLEHRFVAGFNLGATAPLSMPSEVRSINGYHALLTPQIGYELRYKVKGTDWKIGSGAYFEVKGMVVRDRVKYMYTSVVLDEDNATRFSGYFVGKNKTKVQISYLTLPVYVIREINDKWSVRAGGYLSYAHSKKFSGTVSDGYILPENEETGELGKKEEISSASFDFGSDIKNWDFGASAGAEMKINRKLSAFGSLNWSFTPIFP
ncbi:MAG: porin family protein, partial [Dysgonomonas sp.]